MRWRDVLNAFRHHRGRHSVPRVSANAPICAQRLSASQRSALRSSAHWIASRSCAQRLSASQRSAHPRKPPGRPVDQRAQRLSASQRSALNGHRMGTGVPGPSAQRLSASQRSALGVVVRDGFALALCSTPFGITDVGTRPQELRVARGQGAQRLSASQRSALARVSHDRQSQCSAQRLSASQRSALPAPNRLPFHSLRQDFSMSLPGTDERLVQRAERAAPSRRKHPVFHALLKVMDPPNCQ